MARNVVETRRDRIALAHEAGFGSMSFGSALSGVLVAYGAFAVFAAIAGGVLTAIGVNESSDISADWRDVGVGTGVVAAAVLFVSYLWGGYVAGRMARRAGAFNGLLVFLLGLLIAAGVGAAVGMQANTDAIVDELRSIGVPTSGAEWTAIGTIAGIGALAAMLFGSMLGGAMGERWHGKLLTRAMDPTIGPEVDLRDRRPVMTDYYGTTNRDRDGVRDTDGDRDPVMVDRHDADRVLVSSRTGEHFDDTSTTLDDDLLPRQTGRR